VPPEVCTVLLLTALAAPTTGVCTMTAAVNVDYVNVHGADEPFIDCNGACVSVHTDAQAHRSSTSDTRKYVGRVACTQQYSTIDLIGARRRRVHDAKQRQCS
jgi:hypothetical protein